MPCRVSSVHHCLLYSHFYIFFFASLVCTNFTIEIVFLLQLAHFRVIEGCHSRPVDPSSDTQQSPKTSSPSTNLLPIWQINFPRHVTPHSFVCLCGEYTTCAFLITTTVHLPRLLTKPPSPSSPCSLLLPTVA